MNNSQHNSKKRKLNQLSNQQQDDEDLLFGYATNTFLFNL